MVPCVSIVFLYFPSIEMAPSSHGLAMRPKSADVHINDQVVVLKNGAAHIAPACTRLAAHPYVRSWFGERALLNGALLADGGTAAFGCHR